MDLKHQLPAYLAAPGNRTCLSGVTVRCSNQPSCIPSAVSTVSKGRVDHVSQSCL